MDRALCQRTSSAHLVSLVCIRAKQTKLVATLARQGNTPAHSARGSVRLVSLVGTLGTAKQRVVICVLLATTKIQQAKPAVLRVMEVSIA